MQPQEPTSTRLGREPRSVKPMIIGLIIALPLMIIVAVLAAYMQSKALWKAQPAIDASAKFILLVGSGQVADAKSMCSDKITEQELTDSTVAFDNWGTIADVDKSYAGQVHSDADIEVQVLIKFDRTAKIFVGHWDATSSPVKLNSYEFKDAPASATQPVAK